MSNTAHASSEEESLQHKSHFVKKRIFYTQLPKFKTSSNTRAYQAGFQMDDFKLPKVGFHAWDTCCNDSHADTYLGHAKDLHSLSLARLAWAIQNGANSETVDR